MYRIRVIRLERQVLLTTEPSQKTKVTFKIYVCVWGGRVCVCVCVCECVYTNVPKSFGVTYSYTNAIAGIKLDCVNLFRNPAPL